MRILPVLDLLKGEVVHGIAGRRESYRPIVSQLTPSADPVRVALAMQSHFGFDEFYLADLDAIQGGDPNLATYRKLQMEGFRLWIDAGVRGRDSLAVRLLTIANIPSVILGLESLHHPDEMKPLLRRLGAERTVFSLDLKHGRPICRWDQWHEESPLAIARYAIEEIGIRRLIVLDLAGVGVGAGVPTGELCRQIRQQYPEVQLVTGGGVRDRNDVRRLLREGIDRVLVASALHDGRLGRDDLL